MAATERANLVVVGIEHLSEPPTPAPGTLPADVFTPAGAPVAAAKPVAAASPAPAAAPAFSKGLAGAVAASVIKNF